MLGYKSYRLSFLIIFFLKLLKFINASRSHGHVDCFMCSQNIPTCYSCEENEFCYISKRSCYQCSRAICAKLVYKLKRKHCDSSKRHKCRCSDNQTCLLTVRNRVTCPKTVCIDLVGPNIKFLKDYIS
jgi:hypothetical protein